MIGFEEFEQWWESYAPEHTGGAFTRLMFAEGLDLKRAELSKPWIIALNQWQKSMIVLFVIFVVTVVGCLFNFVSGQKQDVTSTPLHNWLLVEPLLSASLVCQQLALYGGAVQGPLDELFFPAPDCISDNARVFYITMLILFW